MPSAVASIQFLGHFESESLYKPCSHLLLPRRGGSSIFREECLLQTPRLLLPAIAKKQQRKNVTEIVDIFVNNSMLASYKLFYEQSIYSHIFVLDKK